MMVNTMDMSAPVTRGELREELDRAFEQRLAPLATKAELAQFATKADLAQFATKADLEPLVTKEYLEERLAPLVTKEYLEERLESMGNRLSNELAQHAKAMEESFQKQVSTFDDKYIDLPGRVEQLERAVFSDGKSDDKQDKRSDDHPDAKAESKKARPSARASTTTRSRKRR